MCIAVCMLIEMCESSSFLLHLMDLAHWIVYTYIAVKLAAFSYFILATKKWICTVVDFENVLPITLQSELL